MCAKIGKFDEILVPVPPAVPLTVEGAEYKGEFIGLEAPLMKVDK